MQHFKQEVLFVGGTILTLYAKFSVTPGLRPKTKVSKRFIPVLPIPFLVPQSKVSCFLGYQELSQLIGTQKPQSA